MTEELKPFKGRIGFSRDERKMADRYAIRYSFHSAFLRIYRGSKWRSRNIYFYGYDKNDVLYRVSYQHLMKMRAPDGKNVDKSNKLKYFLLKAKQIHGDKYDYSMLTNEIVLNEEFLPIICPIHGVFHQRKRNHVTDKQGCWKCGKEKIKFKVWKRK